MPNEITMPSVRERLDSAISYLRAKNLLSTVSVAELCRLAEVSRANVYSNYRDVIDVVGQSKNLTLQKRLPKKNDKGETSAAELKLRIKALQYICLELSENLENERKLSKELRAELSRKSLRDR